MLLWIAFAIVTSLVLAVVLLPVFNENRRSEATRAAFDLTVYKDQLAEIDRDAERGLIARIDADAARNEVKRRMLAAEEQDGLEAGQVIAGRGRKICALLGVVGIPAAALLVYLAYGNPGLPAAPRAERIANAEANRDLPALIAKVELHLAENPQDARGWLILAPIYRQANRFEDAANAIQTALKFIDGDAVLHAELGENIVLANQGLVNSLAQASFEKALQLDPRAVRPQFYLALALAQEGNRAQSLAGFKDLLAKTPPEAPWRSAVIGQIKLLDPEFSAVAAAPQLSQDQIASVEQLAPEDRQALIRSMVDGLAQRLGEDGDDLDGWLRLANARMVLGEKEKALEALERAEHHFRDDAPSLAQISEIRRRLGLSNGDS